MGVILAIGNAIWEHEVGMRFQVYLPWDEAVDSAFFSGFLSFWSYIIILNTVVPISLYVRYAVSLRRGLSRELRWSLGRLLSSVKVKSSRGNLGSSPSCAVNMLSVYLRGQSRLHCSFLGTLDCIRAKIMLIYIAHTYRMLTVQRSRLGAVAQRCAKNGFPSLQELQSSRGS